MASLRDCANWGSFPGDALVEAGWCADEGGEVGAGGEGKGMGGASAEALVGRRVERHRSVILIDIVVSVTSRAALSALPCDQCSAFVPRACLPVPLLLNLRWAGSAICLVRLIVERG